MKYLGRWDHYVCSEGQKEFKINSPFQNETDIVVLHVVQIMFPIPKTIHPSRLSAQMCEIFTLQPKKNFSIDSKNREFGGTLILNSQCKEGGNIFIYNSMAIVPPENL